MKPLQRFVRDVVAPALREGGFSGRGGTYRFQHDDQHQAIVQVRGWRLRQRELEFFTEEAIVVQGWREYIAETMDLVSADPLNLTSFTKAGSADGPVQTRLMPQSHPAGGLWQLDADDHVGVGNFSRRLSDDAAWLRRMADPRTLEGALRGQDPRLSAILGTRRLTVLVVLLTAQRRFDEVDSILPDTADQFQSDRLATWVERRRSALSPGE